MLIGDHYLKEAQVEALRNRVTFGQVQLWEIRPAGIEAIKLAGTDYPFEFGGSTFLPLGISSNDLVKEEALADSSMEASGVLTHDLIKEVDILAGRYNGAKIIHYIVDLYRPWLWHRKHVWWIKSIDVLSGQFKANVVGIEKFLTIPIGNAYEKECSAVFGGPKCNATVVSFGPETVTQVPSTPAAGGTLGFSSRDNRAFRIEAPVGGYPDTASGRDPVWDFGRVTFNSGNNNGLSFRIAHTEFEGGVANGAQVQTGWMVVTLSRPCPFPIRVNDTVTIESGCDGSLRVCRDVYENALNFRGQPEMPDTKETYKGPEQDGDTEEI